MSNLENLVWEQKFRPKVINDCILPAPVKKMLQDILKSGSIPNFLFSGNSGLGKTTSAQAIANELGADLLFINASMDGNLDTLRTTISQFVSTVSFTDSKKIVLLDECDHLTAATQPALRGFLDEFSKNAIFIFTCNYQSRLIPALLSRLTVVDFKFTKEEKQPAAMQMLKRCCQILELEGIKYDKASVAGLVTKNFPDFRKTLGELQRYSTSGEIDTGILSLNDDANTKELITSIKDKNFPKMRQWVANNQPDPASFYRTIYDKLLPELQPASVPQVILLIAQSQFQATHSVDQEINAVAFLIQVMQSAIFK